MITVTTPPLYSAPLTVEDAAFRLGLAEGEFDEEIAISISSVSSEIARLVPDLAIGRQVLSEDIAGFGRELLPLGKRPIDPDSLTVTITGTVNTDYKVFSAQEGLLWLFGGWPWSTSKWQSDGTAQVVVAYTAGYITPDGLSTWEEDMTYAAGYWVKPMTSSDSSLLMECTTGGDSSTTEPTWPAAGSTVVDGSVTWTARTAWAMPQSISEVAFLAVRRSLQQRLPEVIRRQAEGFSETYDPSLGGMLFSKREESVLRGYAR